MGRAVRRLTLALLVWLGVATLTFAMTYLIPADPARTLAGAQADAATIESIRAQLGLNAPLYWRYLHYLGGILHGDFGTSYVTGEGVLPTILERLPATLELAVGALLVYFVVGVGFGIWGGVRPRGWGDRFGLAIAVRSCRASRSGWAGPPTTSASCARACTTSCARTTSARPGPRA